MIRRCLCYLLLASAIPGVLAATASGGTTRLLVSDSDNRRTATLDYRAQPGEQNHLSLGFDWGFGDPDHPSGPPHGVNLFDSAGASAAEGCATAPGEGRGIRCQLPQGADFADPVIRLGDRADTVNWSQLLELGVRVFGGPGADSLPAAGWIDAGSGDDDVDAETPYLGDHPVASVIQLGPGHDRVSAGSKRDVIRARDGSIDAIYCGRGHDTVLVDVLDNPLADCEELRRAGAARAVPVGAYADEGYPDVGLWVGCPRDGPRVCVGSAGIRIGRRVLGPKPFRVRRNRGRGVSFPLRTRAVDRLSRVRYVRATVRSYGRKGRLLRASDRVDFYFEVEYEGE